MKPSRPTLLAAILTVLAACGSSGSAEPEDTLPPATTVAATAASTPEPSTTATPTTQLEEPREFDPTKILHEGTYYTAGDVAIGTQIRFTATAESRYSSNLPGFFGVTVQASGDETLLNISDLSNAFVFKDPLDDYNAYGRDNSALLAASEPVPDDYLAYIAQLPGVTAGPVIESEFAGYAAQSMTYEVGDFAGVACFPDSLCLLTLFIPSGISIVYFPGDSGTMYIFDVGGRRILADVINNDGADQFVATLEIG